MLFSEKDALKAVKLLDIVSDGILLLDGGDKIIFINRQAAFFLGVDQETAYGQNFKNLKGEKVIFDLVSQFKSGHPDSITEMQLGPEKNQSWVEVKIYNQEECLIICFRDISGRKEIEEKSRIAYESIRNLNSHSQKIREDERTMLSREIHDQLGQHLTGMKMEVDFILKKSPILDDFAKEKLQVVLKQIERTVGTIRNISRNLRPGILDDFGLLAALEWHAEEFSKSVKIPVFLQYEGEEKSPDHQKATAIFRVFQESLTNIMRHAECRHVNVKVAFGPEAINLSIIDNGRGFDPNILKDTKSLGILGMKERAESFGGNYAIQSAPGEGTTTVLTMPY